MRRATFGWGLAAVVAVTGGLGIGELAAHQWAAGYLRLGLAAVGLIAALRLIADAKGAPVRCEDPAPRNVTDVMRRDARVGMSLQVAVGVGAVGYGFAAIATDHRGPFFGLLGILGGTIFLVFVHTLFRAGSHPDVSIAVQRRRSYVVLFGAEAVASLAAAALGGVIGTLPWIVLVVPVVFAALTIALGLAEVHEPSDADVDERE